MNKKRLNITIPQKVAEALAEFPNKSKFITEALIEKIQKEKKQRLSALLTEGYQSEAHEDEKTNQEWEDATFEGWPR
jgi:metal-responsive CopG/Arc/MetJ family transcriptional regulator